MSAKPGVYPVRVTPALITRGQRHHPSQDPIALAVTETFPRAAVTVSDPPVVIAIGLIAAELDEITQLEVDRFVRRWDAGQPVEPMNFPLMIPGPDEAEKESKS